MDECKQMVVALRIKKCLTNHRTIQFTEQKKTFWTNKRNILTLVLILLQSKIYLSDFGTVKNTFNSTFIFLIDPFGEIFSSAYSL